MQARRELELVTSPSQLSLHYFNSFIATCILVNLPRVFLNGGCYYISHKILWYSKATECTTCQFICNQFLILVKSAVHVKPGRHRRHSHYLVALVAIQGHCFICPTLLACGSSNEVYVIFKSSRILVSLVDWFFYK